MATNLNRSVFFTLRALVLAISAGFAVAASAAPVCYQWSGPFGKERFVLDITPQNPLSPNQMAYSVHGKHVGVCGYETIAPVTGTLIVSTPAGPQAQGSHLGLRTHSIRATAGGQTFCKEVTVDCTSPHVNTTVTPTNWTCFSRNEWDNVHGGITSSLTKLSPPDGFCTIFQDSGQNGGLDFVPTLVPVPAGGDAFSGLP